MPAGPEGYFCRTRSLDLRLPAGSARSKEARAWLDEVKGVGPKTAAIVLLFSLSRPAFRWIPISIGSRAYRTAPRKRLTVDGSPLPAREENLPAGGLLTAALLNIIPAWAGNFVRRANRLAQAALCADFAISKEVLRLNQVY